MHRPRGILGDSSTGGSTELLPSIRLTTVLSTGGRFSLRITVAGTIPPGAAFTLAVADNADFKNHVTRTLDFEPDGPGVFFTTLDMTRGVARRFEPETHRKIRQRVYLRLEVRSNGRSTTAVASVDPTRVQRRGVPIARWVELLRQRLARR